MKGSGELAVLERGAMLDATMNTPGWSVVLDMLEEQVQSAVADLLACQSPDPAIVHRYQLRARLARDIQSNLLHNLRETVRAAKSGPAPATPTEYLPGIN